MHQRPMDASPFDDFESASRAVLAYLHERLGFSLWMTTRNEGSDWIVLQAEDDGYNVEDGAVFRWTDTFCSQMVLGRGPQVAPRAREIPVYAAAPIAQKVPIGAYIGVPLAREDGSLFGTLCAIDPEPQDDSIHDHLPTVALLAKFLGTVLDFELKAAEQARLLERSRRDSLTDGLTGLLNRDGWNKSLATEEARARRYGSPACVLIVDLDDLKQVNDTGGHARGDALLCSTADCIRSAFRNSDTVARIGGDEFAILGIECDASASEALCNKLLEVLSSNGINASVGRAMRDPRLGLAAAVEQADLAMYAAKAERRAGRTDVPATSR